MLSSPWNLDRDGFCMLHQAIDADSIRQLLVVFDESFAEEESRSKLTHAESAQAELGQAKLARSILARSSRGYVYAARNLVGSIAQIRTVWQADPMLALLRDCLGDQFGLVRALFFDKPPERTWNLPWHKDTSISVQDNSIASPAFSRPTHKAGVPHVIASDQLLMQMLTLRIHLDDVTDENGPLRVIPQSHTGRESAGLGVDCAVTIHARAGDVLAMRPLITHASGASCEGTRRHRRILHLEFASNEFLPDGYRWHDFIRPEACSVCPHVDDSTGIKPKASNATPNHHV